MAWTPYIETRENKSDEVVELLIFSLLDLMGSNNEIRDQLKLLNERIEEAFETKIKRNDV